MTRAQQPNVPTVLAALETVGLVAVVREPTAEEAVQAARSAIRAGAEAIEITWTVPDIGAVLAELAADNVLLGAGTVMTSGQLRQSVECGVQFVVSPVNPPELLEAARDYGVLAIPGVATPQELWTATVQGALAVKLFPAERLGGPAYLRDLRGPFPALKVMASGGVTPARWPEYKAAGAWCVGVNARNFVTHRAAGGSRTRARPRPTTAVLDRGGRLD